jgi:hypothetical protein
MDDRFWLVLLAAIGSLIAFSERKRRLRTRSQRAKIAADKAGAGFADDGEGLKSRHFWKLPAFRKLDRADIRNVVRTGDSIVFQLYENAQDDEKGMTVAAIRVPSGQFPSFQIGPRKGIGFLRKWFGDDEIALGDPIFSESFCLTGLSEARLRSLFGAALRSVILEWKGYSIQGSDRWIVVFQEGQRLEPDELPGFLGRASELAQRFQDALAA